MPSNLGAWKIVSVAVAPWWTDPTQKPDPSETKSLVGKAIIVSTKEMLGPRKIACKGPKYKVKDYPADMLFQGAFGEMHDRDKSANTAKIAATLGFRGSRWRKATEPRPKEAVFTQPDDQALESSVP